MSIESVVILGAGHAGASAAFELREVDFDGRIVLVGDEAHLPYERPQLSKEMLRATPLPLKHIRTQADYDAADIELVLSDAAMRVDAKARKVHLRSGMELEYDRLLIATGTRPRRIPALEGDDRVIYLRTADDARVLGEQLDAGQHFVIVGGGVIGLEVASAICARGGKPVVVEKAERLMMRSLDSTVAAYLESVHRSHGVTFRYGVTITSFDEDLVLSDGSHLPADRILVGIGVEPNIEAVADLGITDAHGVRVDAFGRTSIPEIYATGDVASQPRGSAFARVETWANAQDHAALVAHNLVGDEKPYEADTWFWSDQGELKLQVLGDVTRGTSHQRGTLESGKFSIFYLDADGSVLGCASINAAKDTVFARRWMKEKARVAADKLTGADLREAKV